MAEDISNKKLFGFVSWEMAIGAVVFAFIFGKAFNALSEDVEAVTADVAAVESRSAKRAETDQKRWQDVKADQEEIQQDLAGMKANQRHFKDSMDKMSRQQEKMVDDLDEIKTILMRNYPDGARR